MALVKAGPSLAVGKQSHVRLQISAELELRQASTQATFGMDLRIRCAGRRSLHGDLEYLMRCAGRRSLHGDHECLVRLVPAASRGGTRWSPGKVSHKLGRKSGMGAHALPETLAAGFTESEVAGLAIGILILVAAAVAPRVDSYVSKSQRRDLGLCEACGGVTKLPCSMCNGTGRKRQILAFGGQEKGTPDLCSACSGSGQCRCPVCSKA